MWCGNPTYNARQFNATPGINRTEDFLSIINRSGSTAPVAHTSQDPIPPDEDQELNEEDPSGEQDDVDMGKDEGPADVDELGYQLLSNFQATYEEEEERLVNEECNMDLAMYQDADRDQAMVNAALGTFDDEVVPQQLTGFSHCSRQVSHKFYMLY